MGKYAKTIAAAVAAVTVTVAAAQDKQITPEEWAAVSAAWAGVVAVFGVRNRTA
jgi:hypothetical protein